MSRSMWSGSISFGLVNVPVKLYSAVAKKDIHFHQLHDLDGVRLQLKHVCPADGREVPFENIVKGYEISRDRYVVVTPEELEALDPKAGRTIDIQEFVDLNRIDPIYFEHSYYLVPGTGAAKAYALLLTAMKNKGKVAIARVVIRNKQYLAAIRPMNQVLSMVTMLYADEVVPYEELEERPAADVKIDQRELALAEQIVSSQAGEFDPRKYRDDYRERVVDLIERKAAGQEIAVQPVIEEPGAKVVDLMSALEASLAAIKEKSGAKNGPDKKKSA